VDWQGPRDVALFEFKNKWCGIKAVGARALWRGLRVVQTTILKYGGAIEM